MLAGLSHLFYKDLHLLPVHLPQVCHISCQLCHALLLLPQQLCGLSQPLHYLHMQNYIFQGR